MKLLIKSAWGSDDPTKAAFPFLHANAFVEAGHEVQIFLLGEAVSLLRTPVANAVVPVGWPPLAEILAKTRPQDSHPRLNRVLEGPGGPRHGSGRQARDVRGAADARRTHGVGGQDPERVTPAAPDP